MGFIASYLADVVIFLFCMRGIMNIRLLGFVSSGFLVFLGG
jgi:hypothetical protein